MSIGNVIRKVAGAPLAIGKAVGSGLQEALEGMPEAALAPPTFADAPMPEYQLTDTTGMDPDIAKYIQTMEAAHQAHIKDTPDYGKQFKELSDYVDSKPQPRRFSPLSAFAIAMGNPDAMKNVEGANAKADSAHDKREQYILDLKETAMKGNIQKLMEEGNFKKVLTESAALMELHRAQKAADEKRQQSNEMEKIRERNAGSLANANVRAGGALASASRRAQTLGNAWGLTKDEMGPINSVFEAQLKRDLERDKNGEAPFTDAMLLQRRSDWQDAIEALGQQLHPENDPDYVVPDKKTNEVPPPAGSVKTAPPTAGKGTTPVRGQGEGVDPNESALGFRLRYNRWAK